MAEQIKLTATLSAWAHTQYSLREFTEEVAKGNGRTAIEKAAFYFGPDEDTFCDYTKVGTAEITLNVVSRDDLTSNAVAALKATLEQERAKWLQKQAEILEQISKFQALTFEAPADVEANHG